MRSNEATKQRRCEATKQRSNEATKQRSNDDAKQRRCEATNQRSNDDAKQRSNEATNVVVVIVVVIVVNVVANSVRWAPGRRRRTASHTKTLFTYRILHFAQFTKYILHFYTIQFQFSQLRNATVQYPNIPNHSAHRHCSGHLHWKRTLYVRSALQPHFYAMKGRVQL